MQRLRDEMRPRDRRRVEELEATRDEIARLTLQLRGRG